jgi:hypothetical protein
MLNMGDLVERDDRTTADQMDSVIAKSQNDFWYFHVETIHGSNFICGRIHQMQYLPILHLSPLECDTDVDLGVFSNGECEGYVIRERGIDVPIANISSIGDGTS